MTLGPDARSLIDAASEGDDPSSDDAARVRAKLAARLAMGAAAGAAATVATKGAAASASSGAGASAVAGTGASIGTGVSVATKALLAVALVGGTAASGVIVLRSEEAPLAPLAQQVTASAEPKRQHHAAVLPAPIAPLATSSAPASVGVEELPAAALSDAGPPGASARSLTSEPVAIASARGAVAMAASARAPASSVAGEARAITPATPPRPAEPHDDDGNHPTPKAPAAGDARRPADSIGEEAALLRAANGALARNDAAAALAALDEHAARFPHGVLSEERQAAQVFALCAVGRAAAARTAASAFVAANPRSPHAAQVRRSCATAGAD